MASVIHVLAALFPVVVVAAFLAQIAFNMVMLRWKLVRPFLHYHGDSSK